MKKTLDDQLLRDALLLLEEEQADSFPASFYEPHAFSRRFERRMGRALRKARQPQPAGRIWMNKRVAAILAVLLALFAALMGASAWRMEFFRFVEEKFEEYSIMFYDPLRGEAKSAEVSHFLVYRPTYIPEGFELTKEFSNERVQLRYDNSNDKYISFTQFPLGNTDLRANTEGIEVKPLKFQGYDAFYYQNLGDYSLMWDDGNYSFTVSSNTDWETVLRVAESVQLSN